MFKIILDKAILDKMALSNYCLIETIECLI